MNRLDPLGELKSSPDPESEREVVRGRVNGDGKMYSKHHCQRPHFSDQNEPKKFGGRDLPAPAGRAQAIPRPRKQKGRGAGDGDPKIYSKHHCQRPHFLGQNEPKNVWRPGSARTRWGSLSAPQTQEAKAKGTGRREMGKYMKTSLPKTSFSG